MGTRMTTTPCLHMSRGMDLHRPISRYPSIVCQVAARPPTAPRASDMFGHIGKIVEALQKTCRRVFHSLT
eukprot:1242023-Pyramimonas_sp.AAC.1